MKQVSFIEGAGVALTAAVCAGALQSAFHLYLPPEQYGYVLVPLICAAYVAYLLMRGAERAGRLTIPILWAGAALAVWAAQPELPVYVLCHAGLIWLTRSLYFHSGLLGPLLDLALTALATAGALWSVFTSSSVFLTVWTFFLVQALFPLLRGVHKPAQATAAGDINEGFENAYRSATAALRKLSLTV